MEGTLPNNDLRRAFVAGAKWWEYHKAGATMWQSDSNLAEEEAERRYPDGKPAAQHYIKPTGAPSATPEEKES